ncbi:hypothetical protein IEO21_09591 [Rhodonia placenta]|uniref:Uncharacterized protein n=1 Tax=Rhodonia placenta TaxID=104341 RepID=A0A8H7TY35_9APHY|nr:hypothetical protein IEO21_09591 [Postia placenta]
MSSCCSTSVAHLSASSHVVKVSNSIFRSPYPDWSTGPLNSAENSAASLASSTCAAASPLRCPKRALKAVAKAASSAKGVIAPRVPICTETSWAKIGVAQARASPSRRPRALCTLSSMVVSAVLTSQYMHNWDRNQSYSIMVFPLYQRRRRSFNASLLMGAGVIIIGGGGDGGRPRGGGGGCGCLPGEPRGE